MWVVSSLLCVATWVACLAGTGASPTTVNGARGGSVSLPAEIPVEPDVAQVVWRLLSPRKKIVTYSNKSSEYCGSVEYKRRITLHPGTFSLEIRDLQREDTGDYELTVTASSGAQTQRVMRLQVLDEISIRKVEKGSIAWLTDDIVNATDITKVVWRIPSGPTKIAECVNGKLTYPNTEKYNQRIAVHPADCSLQIHDVQKEDEHVYEVTVTQSSGKQTVKKLQLKVFDPVSGTDIKVQYTTKTCNITLICSANSGSSISFRWWRGGEAVGSGSHYHLQQHGEEKGVKEVLYKCEAWNPISNETSAIWLGDICGKTKSDEISIREVAVGHSAWLTPDILKAANITEVVWRILSGPTKIAECVNGKLTYLDTEKYKQRIALLPGDCSLKIHDVQKEETDVYEVIVMESSGTRTEMKMLLKVFDQKSSYNGWKIAAVIFIVIFIVIIIVFLVCYKRYIKLSDPC